LTTKKPRPPLPPACEKCGQPHVGRYGGQACTGHHNEWRGGGPCKLYPLRGLTVCRSHGGALKHVKAKAPERLAQQETARVLATYAREDVDADPAEVLIDLICWGNAKVKYYRSRALDLTEDELVWGRTKSATGGKDKGDTYEAKPNIWAVLQREAEQDVARYCVDALRVGLKQMELDIAARMADKIMPILDAVLAEFGHDPGLPEVAQRVERILRAA
jgi:hypothetical protein